MDVVSSKTLLYTLFTLGLTVNESGWLLHWLLNGNIACVFIFLQSDAFTNITLRLNGNTTEGWTQLWLSMTANGLFLQANSFFCAGTSREVSCFVFLNDSEWGSLIVWACRSAYKWISCKNLYLLVKEEVHALLNQKSGNIYSPMIPCR